MAGRPPIYIRWMHMAVLVGFAWGASMIELAPLGGRASATPAPDLLFCVAAYLAIRRPQATPLILIGLLALIRDLIGGGPVGLGALSLTFAIALLKRNAVLLRRRGPFYELGVIAVLVVLITCFELTFVTIALAPSPPLVLLALGSLATVFTYVLIALIFRWFFRIEGDPLDSIARLGRGTS